MNCHHGTIHDQRYARGCAQETQGWPLSVRDRLNAFWRAREPATQPRLNIASPTFSSSSYIYIYIPGWPFPCRLHPRRNIPPRIGPRTPSCSTKRQGGRFGTRAIHHPLLARTENPFTDPTGTTDGSVLAHFNYPAEG